MFCRAAQTREVCSHDCLAMSWLQSVKRAQSRGE